MCLKLYFISYNCYCLLLLKTLYIGKNSTHDHFPIWHILNLWSGLDLRLNIGLWLELRIGFWLELYLGLGYGSIYQYSGE